MLPISCIPLESLLVQLGLEGVSLNLSDRERLKSALLAATLQLEQVTGRWILPRQATLTHDFYRADEVLLQQDLLEFMEITNGDGVVIPYSDIDRVSESVIRLKTGRFVRGEAAKPIKIKGVWGWRGVWRQSGDYVRNLPSAPDRIPVENVNGTDALGNMPRFAEGQLIRIGGEMMSVLSAVPALNVITVLRGMQGTITHFIELGATIQIYGLSPDVERWILRYAVQLYKAPELDTPPDLEGLMQEAVAMRQVRVGA